LREKSRIKISAGSHKEVCMDAYLGPSEHLPLIRSEIAQIDEQVIEKAQELKRAWAARKAQVAPGENSGAELRLWDKKIHTLQDALRALQQRRGNLVSVEIKLRDAVEDPASLLEMNPEGGIH
jgi:hypothetical protein